MKKLLKWIAIIIAALLVIAIALPFLINVNSFRPQIESSLTDTLGRKVTVGNLSLSILSAASAPTTLPSPTIPLSPARPSFAPRP